MSFSNYLLLANLYLAAFYIFYKLLLDKETYFKLNRVYLLAAGILSMALPFCRSSWLYNEAISTNVRTMAYVDAMAQPTAVLADTAVAFSLWDVLFIVYLVGMAFYLGKFMLNIFRARKTLSANVAGAAYSFLGKKVIDPTLPAAEVISIHEDVHIKQYHSIDVILFELLAILNWFNPFIHFYKKSLQDIHEFLADEESANIYRDKHAYAILILSNVMGVEPSVLMHGFFKKSLIKKRIYMLHKSKSKRIALLKYGMFLPLFVLAAILSSATLNKNKKLAMIADKVDVEKSIEVVNTMLPKAMSVAKNIGNTNSYVTGNEKQINSKNEKLDWEPFYRFMSQHLRYPSDAYSKNIAGKSQISFKIKNGKVSNVSTVKELGYGCDEEVMKQILSFKDFDKSFDGNYALVTSFAFENSTDSATGEEVKPLDGYNNLSPIVIIAGKKPKDREDSVKSITITAYDKTKAGGISLDEVKDKSSQGEGAILGIKIAQKPSGKKVYDFVSIEKQPQSPGGMNKFYEYLSKAITYPEAASKAGIEGKVFLQFVVEKDGRLTDIEVQRGPGSGINEEAVRVIKASPRWNPGIQNGKPVRVRYNIAVNFNLDKKDSKTKPLYILDGKEYEKGLDELKSSDIESVVVLKDAEATALYGDKGKNGVILITLKKKAKTKE